MTDIKKKVGNACRTKNQIRHSKSSGSSFEYDVQYSLSKTGNYPDIYRTAERGFQRQYDLQSDQGKLVIECKRLKGISWNQLVKIFNKLMRVKPEGYRAYVVFKSNRQPCLVFGGNSIYLFKDIFSVPFLKHESTRVKKDG